MKKHLITFGTLLFVAASGSALLAQDDATARLMAKRAAEAAGTGAATVAPAGAVPQDPATAPAAPAATAGDATTTNTATTIDDDEVRRKAAIAAALKEAETNLAVLPSGLSGLQIITKNNIFDPRRRPNELIGNTGPAVPPVRVESFYLTGTSEIKGRGFVAFFSGAGIPEYPYDHCIGDKIYGFKIKDITFDGVKLVDAMAVSNAAEYDLQPQKGLTRNDGGPWKMAYSDITYVSVAPRMARMDGSEPVQSYQAPLMATVVTPDTTFSFAPSDPSMDDPMNPTGRTRGRRGQNNQGGGGGGGGRQRGGNNGGFGGGNANSAFAPATPAAPAGPVDPAVLARLQARRNAEQ